jgi:iron-sulfur cluster repair protein YtfE (RIC family)
VLVKIGTAAAHPRSLAQVSDPVELLLACHGRIREFGALAVRLAASAGAPAALVADAAAEVHRYHAVGLPLHQADEDESIRPRLEAAGAGPEVMAALEVMSAQHGAIDALLEELCPLWREVRDEPSRLPELSGRLASATSALMAHWDVHLPPEEALVFPAIVRVLSEDARAAILGEIKARRAPVLAAGGFPSEAARRLA